MRRLMVGALLSAFMTSFFAMSASAAPLFTEQQRNAMEHIGQAVAGTARCPRYMVNPKVVMLLGLGNRFNIANANVSKYVEERAMVYRERFAQRTVDDICAALVRVYGPAGTGVANLVIEAGS